MTTTMTLREFRMETEKLPGDTKLKIGILRIYGDNIIMLKHDIDTFDFTNHDGDYTLIIIKGDECDGND